ncbi:MAG: VanZ family protein [Gemmatimonadales bacterium]|nr:VanZ family protein [Gemmatimonadales bacterium]MDZ4389319.1 VanZ family protein [Gemmatimonadales bacterium]
MPTASSTTTGQRLGALLLGYLMLVVGVIVLSPFDFAVPAEWRLHLVLTDPGWVADLLLNVVLFIPFGFIGRRVPGLTTVGIGRWLLIGALLSLLIETTQLFLAVRYATLSDVVANAAGMAVGVMLSDRLVRYLGVGVTAVQRLLLDVPLIGIPYLLLPVLWLEGLAAGSTSPDAWAILPLAAAGGVAFAGAARTTEVGSRSPGRLLAMVTAVWWLVAAGAMIRAAPLAVVLGLTVTVVAAELADPLWRWLRQRERRLEPVVVPVVLALVGWHLVLVDGLAPATWLAIGALDRAPMLRGLAAAATVTLIGYLLAEWRGRAEHSMIRGILLPILVGGAIGWLGVGPRGAMMMAVAAGCGGALYLLQRDHVVALRGAGVGR